MSTLSHTNSNSHPSRLSSNTAPALRGLVVLTVMTVAILEILDSTIVNVALPHMMAALGANQNQITWVVTSYIVASAIMIPLTGYLSQRLGQKKLLLLNISGFMLSSMLCGISHTLTTMVFFRLCQGAFGAALIPLSQSILRQNYALHEQGKAMAIWGIGIMVAPVLGPTIGGYIIQHANWRWIFFMNAPICALALIMTQWIIPQTPTTKHYLDRLGLILMVIGVGALQLTLDEGNTLGWFTSDKIKLLALLAAIGLIGFIWRGLTHKQPLVNLRLFKNRNFALCTLLLMCYAALLFSIVTVQPIMLESLYGYTAFQAGLMAAPSGVASAITMIFVPKLMTRFSVKSLLTVGLLIACGSTFYLSHLTLAASPSYFIFCSAIRGVSLGLFMVPVSTYSLATIDKPAITEAAGMFSYGRMLGTSLGISTLATLIARTTAVNWTQLSAHISIFNPNLHAWLRATHRQLQDKTTLAILQQQIQVHANFMAFMHVFQIISICFLFLIPLAWATQRVSLR